MGDGSLRKIGFEIVRVAFAWRPVAQPMDSNYSINGNRPKSSYFLRDNNSGDRKTDAGLSMSKLKDSREYEVDFT